MGTLGLLVLGFTFFHSSPSSLLLSSPFLLATGGDKGLLALWDLHECEGVMRRFGGEGGGGGKEAGAEAASMMEGMTLGGEGEKEKGERKEKKMEGKKEKKKTGEKSRSCRKK